MWSIKITEDERTNFSSNACKYSRLWSFKTYSYICLFFHSAYGFVFSAVLISQVSSSMKSFVPIQSLFTLRQGLVLHRAVCSVYFAKIWAAAIYLKWTELPVVHIISHHITSYPITSHHITSHHIPSHPITSHHIPSHPITSHNIPSHPITSRHIPSHHITSHHIPSHPITSHPITSYPITSHHILSHPITSYPIISHHITYPITSHRIPSHPITSHHITSHHVSLIFVTRNSKTTDSNFYPQASRMSSDSCKSLNCPPYVEDSAENTAGP